MLSFNVADDESLVVRSVATQIFAELLRGVSVDPAR